MTDLHPHHEDHPHMISRAARRGLGLFVFYFLIYLGFILLNLFAPDYIAGNYIPPNSERGVDLHGLNLALVYGLALILIAIFLAFYYMHLTRPPTPSVPPPPPSRKMPLWSWGDLFLLFRRR